MKMKTAFVRCSADETRQQLPVHEISDEPERKEQIEDHRSGQAEDDQADYCFFIELDHS